eukprot:TRINITY_DN1678_c0_g1_i1.p1 TRINITY_DN1678_c0_g1~~TRINITY_DN1678_c0_g1_i1.p1  ORF type:complete len:1048 (-),score=207.61 TRINITY_DN1678_c0_g1_i1:23-3166(-)
MDESEFDPSYEHYKTKSPFLNCGLWCQFLGNQVNQMGKSKVNYCLGFFACFIVVVVVSLLVTVLSKSPLIFLRLAELSTGEIDIVVESGASVDFEVAYMNMTAVGLALDDEVDKTPYSARKIFSSLIKKCSRTDESGNKWVYEPDYPGECGGSSGGYRNCFSAHCHEAWYEGNVFMIDSQKEKDMGLGRLWPYPDLKPGEVQIGTFTALDCGIAVGDTIWIAISPTDIIPLNIWQAKVAEFSLTDIIGVDSSFYVPLKVTGLIDQPYGKYSNEEKNPVMISHLGFMEYLAEHVNPDFPEDAIEFIRTFPLDEYADQIIFNFPSPRADQYLEANYDELQRNALNIANSIFYKLGFNLILTKMPVVDRLDDFSVISLFLSLVLNLIIFILLFLSVLLIYSLLMINVETKTFEMGVLRMIGSPKIAIIMIMLVQALLYSIPALILGIGLSWIGSYIISDQIYIASGIELSNGLSVEGIIWGILLGLAVPIFASIFPIASALKKNLQDSLDTKRSKTSAVKVTLERSEPGKTVSIPLVIVGTLLTGFGAAVYVVFPLALLSFNLGLLLNIFFFLIIGMMLGLTLLSLNIEPILERIILHTLLAWENAAIKKIISKNLVSHRLRNRKTTIMYSVSLGFIIFISVAYNLEISTFSYLVEQEHGTHLRVEACCFDIYSDTLKVINPAMEELEDLVKNNDKILSHSYSSWRIDDVLTKAQGIHIENIGQVFSYNQYVYSVSPNIFDTSLEGFLRIRDTIYKEGNDLPKQLYSAEGSGKSIMGSLYMDGLALDLDSQFLLSIYGRQDKEQRENNQYSADHYRLKPLAFMDGAPGFKFSQFPVYQIQDFLVSFHTYLNILNSTKYSSIEDVPIRYFIVKLKEGLSDSEIDEVKAEIGNIAFRHEFTMWDYRDEIAPFNTATVAMTYFFTFTTFVAMLISFFSLLSSMYTNVFEQTKEIGILRALGLPKFWMVRIYVEEAFVLVLASSILGILIGITVSYTMTMQQILFTQLPIPFLFPWEVLITVFSCSIIFSILSSCSPILSVVSKRIVQIFRLTG